MGVQWPLLVFSVCVGVASGMFVFLGLGELKGSFKKVRFQGALISLIVLAIGGCISVLHMGHPERAVHLLGNLGSGLSKELFIVAAMGIVALVYLVLAKKDYPKASKVFGVIGAVLGLILPFICGASYLIAARPAWDSFTLPLMYLGAGLAMGTLLMCALVLLKGADAKESKLAVTVAFAGVVIMVITSLAYVAWIALAPNQDPSRSIQRLVAGDLAVMFWIGVVIVGILVPLALAVLCFVNDVVKNKEGELANPKNTAIMCLCAFACTGVGAVVLRVIMYAVGTSLVSYIYK